MPRLLIAAAIAFVAASQASAQVRIKDVTDVAGARSNQLVGFGLVVGLDGTASRGTFTQDIVVQMLQRMGTSTQILGPLPSESVIRSTSVSAVLVTAEIGPLARKGGRVDVTVSAIDDARSLQGGTLIFTPLRGADGNVYAVAQGPLSIGGASVTGDGVQKKRVNVGRIPGGGIIEKEPPAEPVREGIATLLLKNPDFNTARLIAKTINERYPGAATAADPGAVVLCSPKNSSKSVTQLIAEAGLLEVRPGTTGRVVINECTGTVAGIDRLTNRQVAIIKAEAEAEKLKAEAEKLKAEAEKIRAEARAIDAETRAGKDRKSRDIKRLDKSRVEKR